LIINRELLPKIATMSQFSGPPRWSGLLPSDGSSLVW